MTRPGAAPQQPVYPTMRGAQPAGAPALWGRPRVDIYQPPGAPAIWSFEPTAPLVQLAPEPPTTIQPFGAPAVPRGTRPFIELAVPPVPMGSQIDVTIAQLGWAAARRVLAARGFGLGPMPSAVPAGLVGGGYEEPTLPTPPPTPPPPEYTLGELGTPGF